MDKNIFKLFLCFFLIFCTNVYANELSEKGIKINNVDVTEKIKIIDDVPYIWLRELGSYSEDFSSNYAMGSSWGFVDGNYFKVSVNSNEVYAREERLFTKKPILMEDRLYISLEAFAFILEYDYKETDSFYLVDNFFVDKDYMFMQSQLIAHAMGGIDGVTITNSKEAFLYNYENGFKVFEVDFLYTDDLELIAIHDFYNPYLTTEGYEYGYEVKDGLTYDEFKENSIFGYYTPLSFEDIANLMVEHEDMYIVTDTKYTEDTFIRKQFNDIVEIANGIDPSILDRIVPQIYNYEMYYKINEIYDFKEYIFTLYQLPVLEYDRLINFVYENGIGIVTSDVSRASIELIDGLDDYNIKVYVHTINDENSMMELFNRGVYGIYTDFIKPLDFY